MNENDCFFFLCVVDFVLLVLPQGVVPVGGVKDRR
jgi:hypothetical protein